MRTIQKFIFTRIGKIMVLSEIAPQELAIEWSCQFVLAILDVLGNFCVPPLVTKKYENFGCD
jgi:hypothetical protein